MPFSSSSLFLTRSTPQQETGPDRDWERFLELAGKDTYMRRIQGWGSLTASTHHDLGLDTGLFYTTSIIVVE